MAVGVGKHLLRQVESPSTRFHSPAGLDLFTGWHRDPQVHEVAQPNVWVLSNPLPLSRLPKHDPGQIQAIENYSQPLYGRSGKVLFQKGVRIASEA